MFLIILDREIQLEHFCEDDIHGTSDQRNDANVPARQSVIFTVQPIYIFYVHEYQSCLQLGITYALQVNA